MADQNQTVHTVFTGEANLEQARKQLEAFTQQWEAKLGKIAEATDAVGLKTLKTIERFNKFTGAVDKFQRTLEKQAYAPREAAIASGRNRRRDIQGEAAAIEGDLFAYRRKISKALAGTVLEIDAELKKIDDRLGQIGKQRRKFANEISELNAQRDALSRTRSTISSNPYVAGELSSARSSRAKETLRRTAQDDRAMQRAAEDLVRTRVRLLQIETELSTLDARNGGRAPARIRQLRDEKTQLDSLTRAYESVGEVVRRAGLSEGKVLGDTLAKGRRDIVTQARQTIEAENRIAEIKARINQHEAGQNRLNDQQLEQLRLEMRMTEKVVNLNQQDERVLERVAKLKERANAANVRTPTNPADQTQRTLDRLRADGGVGIMGIQTELMANYAIIAGIQQAAYALGEYVVQYEAALAQFQAIAAASDMETASLSATINDLGENTRFSNLQIAETATLLAQAGLSARDTETALRSIAELAAAAGVELKQAADVVTSIASVWNMRTNEYGEIANVLTAALNRTKLGMDQIQLGIQYAANTAQDANVSFVELTSALGAMANAGVRSGSTLGTGLRALIVDLETPTEKARATFDRLGLTLGDLDVRTLGLTQVLANLKEKGFTSADAMHTFEIRAAAAYAALANNIDVMQDLQTDLTSTNAATEANAIQMDTLAAKWTQFTNVMKTAGDGALAPVLIVFKMLLTAGTELISMFAELGPVGHAAAAAISVMVAALAINKIVAATQALGAMATSIRLLPPALAAATGATVALTTAENAATGATTRLTGALTLLGRVPVVLVVAALAAVVTGAMSLFGAFNKTSDRADALKGEINDLTAQLDETKRSIQSVDQTIGKMSQTMDVLADNDILRGQVLREARDRFSSLGLEIDDNTDSIGDMITALEKLRSELQKEFSSELLSLADRLEERIRIMNAGLADGKITSPENEEKLGMAYPIGAGPSRGASLLKSYGPSALFAYDAVMGRKEIVNSSGELQGVSGAELRKVQLDLRRLRVDLQGRLNGETNPKERKKLDAEIANLDVLITSYADLLNKLAQVSRLREQVMDTETDAAYAQFMSGARMPGQIDRSFAAFYNEVAALKKQTLSPDEMVKQADAIAERARKEQQAQYQAVLKASELVPAQFRDRYLLDMSERLSGKVAGLTGWVEPLRKSAGVEDRAAGRAGQRSLDDSQAIDRDLAKAKVDTIKRQMEELEARLANAKTGAEVALLRSQFESLLRQYGPLMQSEASATLSARGYYDRSGVVDALAPLVEQKESNGNDPRYQISNKGALGAMQLIPGTARAAARRLGMKEIAALSDELLKKKLLNDPELNRVLGREELRYLLAKYDGNTVLALAAYNAGPGAVNGWLKRIGDPRTGAISNEAFANAIPFSETKDYVKTIMSRATGVSDGSKDPRLAAIIGSERASTDAEVAARRERFMKSARDKELSTDYAALARRLKEERDTNERQIKFLLDNLTSVEGDLGQLTEGVAKVDGLNKRNFDITEEMFRNDPRNVDRMNDPQVIGELEQLLQQQLLKSAETTGKVLDAYIQARDIASERRIADTQDMTRRAQATPGTSGTTMWLLGQRQDWEEYQAALSHLQAVEDALAIATKARADAQDQLNEAQILAQPIVAEAAEIAKKLADPNLTAEERTQLLLRKSKVEVLLAEAQATLGLAQARVELATATTGGLTQEQIDAKRGVRAATPAQPIYDGAKSYDPSKTSSPVQMILDAANRYKATSGIFADVSETIADGIYGTFDALATGINKTIDQARSGTLTIKGLFQNILGGVLQELQATASKIAANYIMRYLLQTMFNALGAGPTPTPTGTAGSTPRMYIPMKGGGEVPDKRMTTGGPVMNRDSVRILAEPGEVMMRKSAVDFIGKDNLLRLNALGNRRISESGAAVARVIKREPDKVNVWVVSPNQVPPPGPKDIVHHVAQDIAQGGSLKKLVRQVAMGA